MDYLLFFASFQVILFGLQTLLFPNNLTKVPEACFHCRVLGKVGAGVRLHHILFLRSALKTDRGVRKSSPTRYIVE